MITALKRETSEETGLRIKKVTRYLISFHYVSGSGKKARQFNFTVDVTSGDVKLSPTEHDEYYLVKVNDETFETLNISEDVKKLMANATGVPTE